MPPTVLRFVTGNKGKVDEAAAALAPLGVTVEQVRAPLVEVQADTLDEVALSKVASAADHVAAPYFLDDAGLFVDALGGFPGVYSAYVLKTLGNAGVLKLLEGVEDRTARFEAVVAYRDAGGRDHYFKGVCPGRISDAAADAGHGFGYDPIFVPEGFDRTYAEIPTDEKNTTSHRGRALRAFMDHLRQQS